MIDPTATPTPAGAPSMELPSWVPPVVLAILTSLTFSAGLTGAFVLDAILARVLLQNWIRIQLGFEYALGAAPRTIGSSLGSRRACTACRVMLQAATYQPTAAAFTAIPLRTACPPTGIHSKGLTPINRLAQRQLRRRPAHLVPRSRSGSCAEARALLRDQPVLQQEIGDAGHVLDVAGHERRAVRQSVGGYGCIEVLDR
jgi:hypothetical protein